MSRASKRKSDQATTAPPKVARGETARSATSKAAIKQMGRIDDFFAKYSNKDSGMIEADGIEKLCSDLKVPHTDIKVLMLAWKMKAERHGYFTQDEWRSGMKALQVDTITKLRKALPELEKEGLKPENFDDLYTFAFRFCFIEEKQKCLDIDTTCDMLEIVMGSKYRPQVDSFIEFIKVQEEYKAINLDQWTNFLRFCKEISFPDLQNYDNCQAWSLILDNFVEWKREKDLQKNYNA